MKKGIFITFEGGDACGKSSQITLFKQYVQNLSFSDDFVFIREPGGTKLSENIRELVLNYTEDAPTPKAELLMLLASRAQLCEKVIFPALKQGKIVVSDRFYDSTIAYQGVARGIMTPEEILKVNSLVVGDLKPDLTFYLKVSPEVAAARKQKMGQELDRFEKEKLDFHQKVCDGYDYMAKKESERFKIIDASQNIEAVHHTIIETLENFIANKDLNDINL